MRCAGAVRELDPNDTQATGLRRAVGAVRFAQNALLADVKASQDAGEKPSWTSYSLHARWREIRDEVAPWHKEVSKEAYQFGAERLAMALGNWDASRKGNRGGRKVGFPGYRSKGRNDSVKFTATPSTARLRCDGVHVKLPKIGDVRMKERLVLKPGQRITSVTVRERAGRWFASFRIREDAWEAPSKSDGIGAIGVDLGIGDRLATMSDGSILANPRHFREDAARLRRAQKSVSRKQKGSKNRAKANRRVQKIHMDIANRRKDTLHKFTTGLVKNHDRIGIEDLAVAGMGRALKLGKSVMDTAPAEIRRQLAYKSEWYGKTLVVADRWFPSSKMCAACGVVKPTLALNERSWTCACGAKHDRDLNAAINLRNLAASSAVSACGEGSAGHHFGDGETALREAGTIEFDGERLSGDGDASGGEPSGVEGDRTAYTTTAPIASL